MKNVSTAFRNQLREKRAFDYIVTIGFVDDPNQIVLHNQDLMASGCEIVMSAESTAFPLGNAIAKTLTLVLPNADDRWSLYDFYGCTIHVVLVNHIDETESDEKIDLGTFTVITPSTSGSTIEITAVDDLYLADKPYSNENQNIMLGDLFEDVCYSCGLQAETKHFLNSGYVVKEVPAGLTCRQIIGLIAMVAGGNAQILPLKDLEITTLKRNVVHIATYDFSAFANIYDGGNFKNYTLPQILDGGDFTFTNTGDIISGGSFIDMANYHNFARNVNLTCETDDVIISGIQTTVDDVTYKCGGGDYILDIENELIKDDIQTAVDLIGAVLIGATFRIFESTHTAYPLADLADLCIIQGRRQDNYYSVITDITFAFKGATIIKCSAESPMRTGSMYSSSAIKAVQQARRDMEKKMTAFDLAVQDMNKLALNSMGYFETFEDDPVTGGRISYLHDKPDIKDSIIIYKKTIDGFFLSQDGGKTYTNGFKSDGTAVLNLLNAIGINAEWINTGILKVGNTGGNESGAIKIYNGSIEIGSWDKNGLVVKNPSGTEMMHVNSTGAKFTGEVQATSGKFTGEVQASSGSFTGEVHAGGGDIAGFTINQHSLTGTTGGDQGIWIYPPNSDDRFPNGGIAVGQAGVGLIQIGYNVGGKAVIRLEYGDVVKIIDNNGIH